MKRFKNDIQVLEPSVKNSSSILEKGIYTSRKTQLDPLHQAESLIESRDKRLSLKVGKLFTYSVSPRRNAAQSSSKLNISSNESFNSASKTKNKTLQENYETRII